MKTLLLAPLLFILSLNAATYDDTYRVTDLNNTMESNYNIFMHGNFAEIIRYEMINIQKDKSNKVFHEALNKAQELQKNKDTFKVSIIGHTNRATDDANEQTIDSNTYANTIQNSFRYSLDTRTSKEKSTQYAQEIKQRFLDANISLETLFVESRGGLDQGFSEETSQARELSNRVMISIYVYESIDIDSDKDGVYDKIDKCVNTPMGTIVDAKGCPKDSDKDGVLDYKDKCPKTPKSVVVDKDGCPLDSDNDGILDYKDKCPKTLEGLKVDLNGCPLSSSLKLNFNSSSDKILTESYPEIQRFAKFLKENPNYKVEIIGHTDSSGKAVSNMELSQKRAAATKRALVAEGIEESRIKSSGLGELQPIETNRTKEGRLVNRRIEIKLFY